MVAALGVHCLSASPYHIKRSGPRQPVFGRLCEHLDAAALILLVRKQASACRLGKMQKDITEADDHCKRLQKVTS